MAAAVVTGALPLPRRRWLPAAEVAPGITLVILALLVLLPISFVLFTSVQSAEPGAPTSQFSLSHWSELSTARSRLAMFNTLRIGAMVSLLSVAIGLLLAWLVTRTDIPARRVVAALVLVPLLVSPLFTGMAWVLLSGPRAGWINAAFRNITHLDRPLFDIYSLPGIVLVLTLHYAPYAYLLIVGALNGVDPGLENASRVSGAGLFKTLRRVVFPVVTPAILSAFLLIFTLACEHFPVTTLLGLPGKVPSLQYDIYSAMVEFPTRANYAAAASVVLLGIAVVALALYNYFTRRQQRYVTVTGKPTPPKLVKLGRWRSPALIFCFVYFALAVLVPLVSLITGSLMKFITPNLAPGLFTTDNYRQVLSRPDSALALRNTLVYGLVTATLIVLAAGYISHIVVRRRSRFASAVGMLAMLPASLPALTFGLGVLWAYSRLVPQIYGTVWIILLAYLTRLTPYGVRVLTGSVIQIDAELEHAARVSGSSPFKALARITLPLVRPALLAAWALVFTQVILEVSMTVLLYTAPTSTLAIRIWFDNFGGSAVLAYSLAVILAGIGFVMLALSNRFRFQGVRAVAT